MDFKVSSTTIEDAGVMLVSVEGELDIASAEQLVAPTEVAVGEASLLILDLSQCSFIDSSGLRLVLHANHALSDVGARLVLVTDQPQAKRLLSVTGIDQRLPIFEALDEALAWFGAVGGNVPEAVDPSTAASTNGRPAKLLGIRSKG
jgi:anti-sigma B factor antagonist